MSFSLSFLSSVILLFSNSPIEPNAIVPSPAPVERTFEEDCLLYGIVVDEGFDLYCPNTDPLTFVKYSDFRYDQERLQYQTDIQHVLLRYEETNIYCYLCRIVVNPVCKERDFGFLGIGSKWDNWYFNSVNVSFDLPREWSIGNWTPQNDPNVYETSVGISLSNEGVGISATVSYAVTLDTISRTNVANNHFEVEYTYNPLDEYSHNTIIFTTMLLFQTPELLNINNFPLVNFKTIYDGKYYFHKEERNFSIHPYLTDLNTDYPTT